MRESRFDALEGRLNSAVGQFHDVLRLLNRLKLDGVIQDYAIGGAVAVSLWAEPVATQDLDVIVTIAGAAHPLDPLRPLFDWFAERGMILDGEHVMISGVPVQFLVAWSPLVAKAVATAAETSYDPTEPESPTIRLIQPTYLVAMWQTDKGADTPRRRERALACVKPDWWTMRCFASYCRGRRHDGQTNRVVYPKSRVARTAAPSIPA